MSRHPDARWPDPDERRQLWALDVRLPEEAPLVRIEPGQASVVRGDCRAGHLICPLPDCDDRRLTSRGGAFRRDHFAHRAGAGGHGPESVAHWAAKHLVGIWLRAQAGVTGVHVDDATVETGQRPDVSGRLPDGRLLAIEVQYASLPANEWWERHLRYQGAGILDIWLWGQPGRWLHEPDELNHYRFPQLLARLAEGGFAVRWFDPRTGELLAPRMDGWDHLPPYRTVWTADLADAYLWDGRLIAPFDDTEAQLRAKRHGGGPVWDAAAIAREEDRREAASRKAAEETARLEAEIERRRLAKRPTEAQVDAWRKYQAGNVRWIKNVWQAVRTETPEDRVIPAVAAHWHALLLERYIVGHVGDKVEVADATRVLLEMSGIAGDVAHEVAAAYFGVLMERGYLAVTDRSKSDGIFLVAADSDEPEVPHGEAPRPVTPAPARSGTHAPPEGQGTLFD
jgi:Competence protein CoiA-like family